MYFYKFHKLLLQLPESGLVFTTLYNFLTPLIHTAQASLPYNLS